MKLRPINWSRGGFCFFIVAGIYNHVGFGHSMAHSSLLVDQRGQACVIGIIDHSLCKGHKHRDNANNTSLTPPQHHVEAVRIREFLKELRPNSFDIAR